MASEAVHHVREMALAVVHHVREMALAVVHHVRDDVHYEQAVCQKKEPAGMMMYPQLICCILICRRNEHGQRKQKPKLMLPKVTRQQRSQI